MRMGTRSKAWDEYEAALLLVYCLAVEAKEIPRKEAVKQVSDALRARAVRQGVEIDDVFRNENGISMQMSGMLDRYHGKTGLVVSKLFQQVITQYKKDPREIVRILQEEADTMERPAWQRFMMRLMGTLPSEEEQAANDLPVPQSRRIISADEMTADPESVVSDAAFWSQLSDDDRYRLATHRTVELALSDTAVQWLAAKHCWTMDLLVLLLEQGGLDGKKEAKEEIGRAFSAWLKKHRFLEKKSKISTAKECPATEVAIQEKKEEPRKEAEADSLKAADEASAAGAQEEARIITTRNFSERERVALAGHSIRELSLTSVSESYFALLEGFTLQTLAAPTTAEKIRFEKLPPWVQGLIKRTFLKWIRDNADLLYREKMDASVTAIVKGKRKAEVGHTASQESLADADKISAEHHAEDGSKAISGAVHPAAKEKEDISQNGKDKSSKIRKFTDRELGVLQRHSIMELPMEPFPEEFLKWLDGCTLRMLAVPTMGEKARFGMMDERLQIEVKQAFSKWLRDNASLLRRAEMQTQGVTSEKKNAVDVSTSPQTEEGTAPQSRIQKLGETQLSAEELIHIRRQFLAVGADNTKKEPAPSVRTRSADTKTETTGEKYQDSTPQTPSAAETGASYAAAPAKTQQPLFRDPEEERYLAVLCERFPTGCRDGILGMKRFIRAYNEKYGTSLDDSDAVVRDAVEAKLHRFGIRYNDRTFAAAALLSEAGKAKLFRYIEDTFAKGVPVLYYDALFDKFDGEWTANREGITTVYLLREYLRHELAGGYHFAEPKYIAAARHAQIDIGQEVKDAMLAYGGPMQKTLLYQKLPHIPQDKIDIELHQPEYIYSNVGECFHVSLIDLSVAELAVIREMIQRELDRCRFMGGRELVRMLQKAHPEIMDRFSAYRDISLRDAIGWYLREDFSFQGNVISGEGQYLSAADVYTEFARTHDEFTLADLERVRDDFDFGNIYFYEVCRQALRISQDEFRAKSRASFDIERTDAAIDRFCTGPYIPLRGVSDFGYFPPAGYPWNIYLLEQYVFSYSGKYKLITNGFNAYASAGVIVRRDAGLSDMESIMADALAKSGVKLMKNDILQYLQDEGYIVRKRLSQNTLTAIINKARALQRSPRP